MSSIRPLWTVAGLALAVCCVIAGAVTARPDVLTIGAFSSASAQQVIPTGWERITFGKIDTETEYNLVRAPGDSTVVLRATSDGGASGLVTKQRIDPTEYPILQWRWRVSNVIEDGNARTKDGDDYAARIYVTFDHDPGLGGRIKRAALKAMGYDNVPSRALNYVWANRVGTGQIFASAYTDWVMMVPVRSGPAETGRWMTEERNIVEDYRRAFGEEPPAITGIAIMTDTDNTGEKATAYYGDIVSLQR